MLQYMLDTAICIYVIKNYPPKLRERFNRLAEQLHMDRKQVLWVYMQKHFDGILAYINGFKSQREDVRGRIKDARLYLALLRGMIEEEEQHANAGIGHESAETVGR